MSETKFTPGPLVARYSEAHVEWTIETKAGDCVAVVDDPFPRDEVEANAHLIAAAPELYEMVGRLIDPNEDLRVLAKEAAAILAKARGETL